MKSVKPVGIWIRVSTEDQARGESPEHHEKRARAYAESKGWQVQTVYHLEAVSGKYTCYTCRNKIGTTDLEEIFQHQLKNFFFSSDEMTRYLQTADQMIAEKEALLHTLHEEEQKLNREIKRIYDSYIAEEMTGKEFVKWYRPLEERREQIERQIPELQGEVDFLKIQYLSSDQILNEAKDLYARWPELVFEEKRKIV